MSVTLKIAAAAALVLIGSTAARADACSDLIGMAELGLKQQGIDAGSKSALETLLEIGKSGDAAACSSAATGSLMSPRPEGGRKCEKSQPTV